MESKMKAKNELNGTDKAVSDNQTVVVQVVADSASKRKGIGLALEIVLWVLAIFCLPIVNIILWTFRLCNLKRKHPERERVYMWVIFPFMVVADFLVFSLFILLLLGLIACSGMGETHHYTGKDVCATKYGTAEALYELTGVRFPEIIPVDSSEYEDWAGTDSFRGMTHKYVLPEEVDESFYECLKEACIANPDHWKITDSSGNGCYYYKESYMDKDLFKSYSISVGVDGNTVTLRESSMNSLYYDEW
ncbi:MAG: hypothetical protein IAB08_00380 [Bacteroidetes bacterium]|uniref:Uncharacterized protein n=1 Tax=Candidatus Pullibacteroides excrementavium TaxID=2840905 RepID=A0A9D9DQ28_9BACT|nr:hypothetical protein [Candidatus Pullibacteroides excrementavium]